VSTDETFTDILTANEAYAADFSLAGLPGQASKGLCVLTCMDTRLDPLRFLGLQPGEAKMLRNAGGRVTPDVLATFALSAYLLGVDRIMVIQHTRCAMASGSEDDIHAKVAAAGGPDTRSLPLLATTDQESALRGDVQRVRSSPYLTEVTVGGFVYDVDTGRVRPVC